MTNRSSDPFGVRHRSTNHGTIWEGVYAKSEGDVLTTAASVDEAGAWNQLNQCLAGQVPWSEHLTQLGRTLGQLRRSADGLTVSQSDFLNSLLERSARRSAAARPGGPLNGPEDEAQAAALDDVFYRMACVHDALQQGDSVRASLLAEDRAVAVRSTPLWRELNQLVDESALALAVAARTFGFPHLAELRPAAGGVQVAVSARDVGLEDWAAARTAEWIADPDKQAETARRLACLVA